MTADEPRAPHAPKASQASQAPHPPHAAATQRAAALYGTLFHALPAGFRRRHAAELRVLFRELAAEAAMRSGVRGIAGCLVRESLDLLVTAVRLRFRTRRSSSLAASPQLSLASAGPISHLNQGSSAMETLRQDIGYALRAIVHRPGFTIIAAITLGLGIGATTAIFSVVNSVILKPLPYPEPERITMFWQTIPSNDMVRGPHAYPNIEDYRKSARSFESLAAYTGATPATVLVGSESELHFGLPTNASLFSVLGVAAAEGRVLAEADDQAGAPRTVVLSHVLATHLSGGRGSMVGKSVTIDRIPHTVVGVMPEGFAYPNARAEYWTPIVPMGIPNLADRDTDFLTVIGRLRPGVPLAAAQAEAEAIHSRLAREYPKENGGRTGVFLEGRQQFVTGDAKPVLFMLLGVVGFVLAIACANLANLMLARGSSRRRELAVRMALGADRPRLIRQLLTESMVLALLGGLLGIAIAFVGTRLLSEFGPAALPRKAEIGVDLTTLAFTSVIAIISGLAAGLFPAYRFSRPDLQGDLKGGAQGTARLANHRVQRGLVVVQLALALVLLVGAGLLTNSLMRLMTVDPGFDPRNVLAVRIAPPADRYTEPVTIDGLYARLLERVAALPGVESAGAAYSPPFASSDYGSGGISVEGQPGPPGRRHSIAMLPVRGDYFETMKIRLLEGRFVTDADGPGGERVVVINEGMATRFWPGESAVGKRFRRGASEEEPNWHTIVGVVTDVKVALDTVPGLQGYWPHSQAMWARDMTILVRTTGDPLSLANAMRAELRAIDPEIPIVSTSTMEESVAASVSEPRFRTLLVLAFAGVAFVLALVGIYGVMAFVVAERTHEIGLRMALGAEQGGVVRHVLGQGFRLTAAGIVVGLVGALAATPVIRAMLFGVGTADPLTYGVVILALVSVAMLACYVPARRASRVDPLVALKAE